MIESLQEYRYRLEKCIDRNMYRPNARTDDETIEFLKAYLESIRPKVYHSCDDPECIICGSPE